jgi:cell division protein FtsA
MPDKSDDLLVALDIGSSKIVCAVAEPVDKLHFRLLGLAKGASQGMREGNIVDIMPLCDAVRDVLKDAEQITGREIKQLTTGISGPFVTSENTNMMQLTSHNEVELRDVESLIAGAQNMPLPATMRYLSVIPQEFGIDNNWGVKTPVGLVGSRLEARLHVVTAKSSSCQNIVKALRRNGVALTGNQLSFNPIVAAEAVLTPEEKRLGALYIDIGHSLTDVSLYSEDAVRYSKAFSLGGRDITNEISVQTKLATIDAEKLKINMGMVDFRHGIDPIRNTQLPDLAALRNCPRVISNAALAAIMENKLTVIFDQIYREIRSKNLLGLLTNGVVLAGGSSYIPGIDRLAQRIFSQHLPDKQISVRIGRPIIGHETMKFYAPEAIVPEDYPKQLAYCSIPEYATVFGYLNDLNRRFWEQSVTAKQKGWFRATTDYVKGLFLGNF